MEKSEWSPCEDYVRLSGFSSSKVLSIRKPRNLVIWERIIEQFDDVNYAIPEGSPVERYQPELVGYTALHFAAKADCTATVNRLLEAGADPTLTTRAGYSAVRLAAESSKNHRQRRCLDLQGIVYHPTLSALIGGQIRTGNVTNVSCRNGVSHMHLACVLNDGMAVRYFLEEAKVSPDQAVNHDSPILPGYTGLHFAARYGSYDAFAAFLSHGASLAIADAAGLTALQLHVKRCVEISQGLHIDRYSEICLREVNVSERITDMLLGKYESLSKVDLGMTKLQLACCKFRDLGLFELVERMIVEEGADVSAAIDLGSAVFPGYTALHFAAHCNVETALLLLLKHGADIAAKDANGITPFDICTRSLDAEHVRRVVDSVKSLRDIRLTDGSRLSDAVLSISESAFAREGKCFPQQVRSDSPLWPGHTMLHLLVDFARRTDEFEDMLSNCDVDERMCDLLGEDLDELLRKFLRKCAALNDLSVQNANGMTALHLAFRQQKKKLVTILLEAIAEKGMTNNPSDFGNLSHLHIMSVEGCARTISLYLDGCDGQVDVNSAISASFERRDGLFHASIYARLNSTPLHLAVAANQADVAQLLLQHGADPLARNVDGLNPLQLAFVNKILHEPMKAALLPAYRSRRLNPVTSEGLSHFLIACYCNDRPLVEELLECGLADVEASINCGLTDTNEDRPDAIKTSACYTSQCDSPDDFLPLAQYSGYRALHMAVVGRALEVLELLLSRGADARVRNTAGSSPLQLALQNYTCRDIVARLAEKRTGFYDGLTMLHIACLFKDTAAIKNELESGADVDAQLSLASPIWPGSSTLHLLFENCTKWNTLEPILELLVSRGANVNQLNAERLTPIHLAYNKNDLQAVKLMLRSSRILESNPADDNGFSHFHIACFLAENSLIEEYLIRGLASLNYPTDHFAESDCAGYAPIHYAFIHGNYATAEVLLQHGADVFAKDRHGSTILHVDVDKEAFSNKAAREIDILRRIIAKADVNAVDIFGRTPLEVCLKNEIYRFTELLLRYGARGNFINPVSREGLLGMADAIHAETILEAAIDICKIDPDTEFNAIHNIVSSNHLNINSFDLTNVIERLIKKGCDIDKQDIEGKTPLHVAVLWKRSSKTVQVLLSFGADINITDKSGMTSFAYCKCYDTARGAIISHIDGMNYFGFYLNDDNLRLFNELCDRCDNTVELLKRHRGTLVDSKNLNMWNNELSIMHSKVIFDRYSFANLLSRTAVQAYPSLSKLKRSYIADSISTLNTYPCKNLVGLLKLQHRKCLRRMKMMEFARAALQRCARQRHYDFRPIPDLCLDIIISWLTNEDMMSLIRIVR